MKKIRSAALFFVFVSIFTFMNNSLLFCQTESENKIAILPFYPVGVDPVSTHSAELLLRYELQKADFFDLISEKQISDLLGEETGIEIPFAIETGEKLAADQVLTCKLVALGEKVIVQYMLINVADKKVILLDQTTSTTVEDLDAVMKRVAMAVLNQKSFEKTAEVGTITESETIAPRRRSARRFTGFSFGYLYPLEGYDDADRSFTIDFRTGAELKYYTVGMQLAYRKGFAMNVFMSYPFTKTDFSPYIGGGFGFHWVRHSRRFDDYFDPYYYQYPNQFSEEEKKGDGFEVTANAGFTAFQTYNFHIIVNFAYLYTINDYDDRALVFTIGLLHQ